MFVNAYKRNCYFVVSLRMVTLFKSLPSSFVSYECFKVGGSSGIFLSRSDFFDFFRDLKKRNCKSFSARVVMHVFANI